MVADDESLHVFLISSFTTSEENSCSFMDLE